MGAIHATEHAAIGLFPLLALCDRFDIGGISYPHHPQIGGPAFFIYDGQAGGIGLAAQGHERIRELLDRTRRLVATCPCEDGCPSCVQSPKCGNGNRPLDKAACLYLLAVLCGLEPVPESRDGAGAVTPTMKPPLVPESRQEPEIRPGRERGPLPPGQTPAAAGDDSTRPPLVALAPAPDVLTGATPPPDLIFDLETLRSAKEVGGWDHIADMGLALGVVWDRGQGRWRVYREEDAKDLIIDLLSAHRVVGFNVRRFDYAVLSAYAAADFSRIPTLDLLDEIHTTLGFRLSLANLAETTLGVSKSGDGLASLQWVREGRWDLVESYCRKDVELTARLYDHGRLHGHLLCKARDGRTVRIPARWGP